MRILPLFVLLFLSARVVFATAQMPEHLRYKNEDLPIYSTPLESAFSETRPRPDDVLTSWSTANWRGYVGHWAIDEGHLVLTGLYRNRYTRDEENGYSESKELIPAEKVFGPEASYPIKAVWFTGKLRIPQGELVRYVHMGFGSQYERELLIDVSSGKVVREVEFSYDPEKDAFRSSSDMQWVALGETNQSPTDDSDWIDGRLLPSPFMYPIMHDGRSFKTRGIFFTDDEGPYLWIPETQKTTPLNLPIHKLPSGDLAKGSHVEIEARFYVKDGNYELEATAIRSLRPGETIHHPTFPEQWQEILSKAKAEADKSAPASLPSSADELSPAELP